VFVATALQPIPTINGEVLEPGIRVALLKSGLGDDGAAVHALVAANFDGLVVEAAGGGHVRPGMADALELAAATIPVLMCSRTGAGATLANTYGFVGGEIDLLRRGVLAAGWLDGVKARVLLALLLRRGIRNRAAIVEALSPWTGGELAA